MIDAPKMRLDIPHLSQTFQHKLVAGFPQCGGGGRTWLQPSRTLQAPLAHAQLFHTIVAVLILHGPIRRPPCGVDGEQLDEHRGSLGVP